MVKSQTAPVPQNIPGPTTNIPQQPIVNGNPMASNTTTHKHIFDGTITLKVEAPANMDPNKLYAIFETQKFGETITKIVRDKNKETEA